MAAGFFAADCQVDLLLQNDGAVAASDVPCSRLRTNSSSFVFTARYIFWEHLMWIADVAALISRQPMDGNRTLTLANEASSNQGQ